MARISDEELSRLKREVEIARLVADSGVKLEKHGADLHGLCPFHDDKEPSLVVSPAKNLWHCLGACRVGGSVVDWVMRRDGVSFRRAIEILRGGRAPAELDVSGRDAEVLGRVVEHYQSALEQSPEALAYLDTRGLSRELVARFRLGYADRTLGYRVSKKGRERLQELGVLRESGHEHLNGSLVVPLVDEAEHIVNLYGRKIRDDLRPGTPAHLYLPGPHRGLFNPQAVTSSQTVIVCEAILDALTFLSAGIDNVTTAYGIEGFTGELMQALVIHRLERVLIAYDADTAGDAAAEQLAKKLEASGIASSRIVFPKGMDANEYARKVQPSAKSLALVVARATPIRGGAPVAQTAPARVRRRR